MHLRKQKELESQHPGAQNVIDFLAGPDCTFFDDSPENVQVDTPEILKLFAVGGVGEKVHSARYDKRAGDGAHLTRTLLLTPIRLAHAVTPTSMLTQTHPCPQTIDYLRQLQRTDHNYNNFEEVLKHGGPYTVSENTRAFP